MALVERGKVRMGIIVVASGGAAWQLQMVGGAAAAAAAASDLDICDGPAIFAIDKARRRLFCLQSGGGGGGGGFVLGADLTFPARLLCCAQSSSSPAAVVQDADQLHAHWFCAQSGGLCGRRILEDYCIVSASALSNSTRLCAAGTRRCEGRRGRRDVIVVWDCATEAVLVEQSLPDSGATIKQVVALSGGGAFVQTADQGGASAAAYLYELRQGGLALAKQWPPLGPVSKHAAAVQCQSPGDRPLDQVLFAAAVDTFRLTSVLVAMDQRRRRRLLLLDLSPGQGEGI